MISDEDFHRLEHKVDELLARERMKSMASQGDHEAIQAVSNFVPQQANEPRVCPVCTHIVTVGPDPKFDATTGALLASGLRRNCNCKVITVK